MPNGQRKLIHFAAKYPDKWHAFAQDYQTVDIVCACANCGLIVLNDFNQFKITQFGIERAPFIAA
jgi:hypothetical protein